MRTKTLAMFVNVTIEYPYFATAMSANVHYAITGNTDTIR